MSKKFNSIEEYDIEKVTNKEKLEIFKNEVDSINKKDIYYYSEKLHKINKERNNASYKYRLDELELRDLEKEDLIKKYIKLREKVEELKEKIELYNMEENILHQEFCSHLYLYLMEYDGNKSYYDPLYKCLCCGKEIKGFLKQNQLCINDQFLNEKNIYYKGNSDEYDFLKSVYGKYKHYINTAVSTVLKLKLDYYNNK